MAIKELDKDTVNSIYNKFIFTSNAKVDILERKTVVSTSNNLTSLQNSFNVFLTSLSNINKLTDYKVNREKIINREKLIESRSSLSGLSGSASSDFSILIKGFGILSNTIEQLNDKLQQLDLTSKCDIAGSSDIDDIDTRRSRRRSARPRIRSNRFRLGGRLLGAVGVGLDIYSRLDEGQSLTQTAVGVGGGLAGAAAGGILGAKVGAGVGALFGGVGAAPGAAIGGFVGSIGGYFAGGALADKGYEAVTKPELSETSYSSELSRFILNSVNTANMFAVSPFLGGAIAGAAAVNDLFFGKGAGSSENAERAMAFFMSQEGGGWTREQAAGIVGNLQGESGKNLNPAAAGDNGNAYGIAQWNRQASPDRVANFKKIIGVNLNESTFEQQLKFIAWELQNSERSAGSKLRAATDVESATVAMSQYERYKGYKAGLESPETRKRIANAKSLLDGGDIRSELAGIQAATDMMSLVGFKPVSSGRFASPTLNMRQTSAFGARPNAPAYASKDHKGLDFGASVPGVEGDPIFASDGGIVTYAGPKGTYGNLVEIDHGNGYKTRYAHLSKISVRVGQTVSRGQSVGLMGKTGKADYPVHLHFEILRNGKPIDPAPLLTSIEIKQSKNIQDRNQATILRANSDRNMLLDPRRRVSPPTTVILQQQIPVYLRARDPSRSTRAPRGSGGRSTNYYTN